MKRGTSSFAAGIGLAAILGIAGAGGASAADKPVIGFSMPDLSESFWISMAYGVDDEAKKAGAEIVKVNAGGDANVNQQISQIQDLIQRHVAAIIIGATNGGAVKAAVEQAVAAGIPVVGLSSIPASDKIASAVGADHYAMGKLQAECLAKAVGEAGEVGMMAGPTGQSWADNRANGFRETIAKSYPKIKVAAESRLADNRNSALTTAEDWLQRFPDLKGVYSATDDIGAGVVGAVKAGGKSGDIKVSSSNLSPTAVQMLKDGSFVCVSIQQIVLQGRAAVQQALKAAAKQPTEASVATPAILVTKDNLATVDMSEVTAPADYKP
jgi:TMAO reductase system protein TorT